MHTIQFWKSWTVVYQRLLGILAVVFLSSLAIATVSFVQYPAPLFTWQQLQELQQEKLPIYSFETGGFDLTVFADNYILFERWVSNPLQVNMAALDLYLILFAIALVVLFAFVTVLPRFWFFAGASIAVFMISSFQLEALQIFGLTNRLPTIGVMIMLLAPGLYYQFINTTASFLQRILIFFVVAVAMGTVMAQFSAELHPLRYFAIQTLPASFALLAIFLLMVAHEIMAAFVSLVGQGTRNSKSLQHYSFISLFYLLNLWLAYATKIGWIDWGFIIHPLLLLGISAVLAVWGIRQRQPQYEKIVSADPFGVYFILALGTVSTATVGYLLASASDVALRSLNYIILYTQIGYGMVFLMYMASNFMGMLSNNFPVYKVLYKPTSMPYFTFRFAGLIFTIALLVYNSWMGPLNNFKSTYYTSIGDLYASEKKSTLAMGYYKRAHYLTSYNQHAATALAALEDERNKTTSEARYLADANKFKPTEFTLLNAANFIYFSGKGLEEILFLQEAKRLLPESGVIKNNLALTFARLGVIDSAYIYFSKAREHNLTEASAEMNLLGLMAKNNLVVNADSIYQLLHSKQQRVKSNALAFANSQQKLIDVPIEFPKDSILNLFSAALIGNFITNHLHQADTSFLKKCIAIAHKRENQIFNEMLLVPTAKAFYAAGQVSRAFQLLREVIASGNNQGTHNTTLALWSLDQGKPDVALTHLKFALNQKSTQAILVNAVAIMESGKVNESIIAWDTLRSRKDSVTHAMAESMVLVLACPVSWYNDLKEKEKYQYLRYRVPLEDSLQFERLLTQIISEDLKAKALLDRSKKWFSRDEIARAVRYYQKLQGLHLTDMRLFDDIKYFELRLYAAQGQWSKLQEQIKKGIVFGPYREGERIYYDGLIRYTSGDTVQAAKQFNWLAYSNPYFDEGIVTAAAFFKGHSANKLKVYTILSEALLVNPNSVKILKAYIAMAHELGYNAYTSSALRTLQPLISPSAFQKFVTKYQLSGSLRQ